jgi:hypothetical protein
MRSHAVAAPLAKPNTPPKNIVPSRIGNGAQPRWVSIKPAAIDEMPSSEPTDKSIPPVRMTSVSPTAKIPREANAPIAFERFVPFKEDVALGHDPREHDEDQTDVALQRSEQRQHPPQPAADGCGRDRHRRDRRFSGRAR